MWVVDLDKKVVHNQMKPAYECKISQIPKDRRKKLFTLDGVKRFLDDPLNKGYQGCQYCMPEFYEHNMNKIFQ